MMEAGAMSAASIQATLEAHAAVARRLNREYELTAPAPTGVNAQGLERRDLRRLVVLASEPLLRRIFKNLTRADLQELQSTLDDEEGKFREYELLASQNFLRDLYDRAPTVAPTVAVRPEIPRPDPDVPVDPSPAIMPELRDVFAQALAEEDGDNFQLARARRRRRVELDTLAALRSLGRSMPDTATRGDILRAWAASDAVYERAAHVAREWAKAKEWREREWADPVRGRRNFF
mgnify:FL=1